jgi:hypothetical protein
MSAFVPNLLGTSIKRMFSLEDIEDYGFPESISLNEIVCLSDSYLKNILAWILNWLKLSDSLVLVDEHHFMWRSLVPNASEE